MAAIRSFQEDIIYAASLCQNGEEIDEILKRAMQKIDALLANEELNLDGLVQP